MELFRVSFSVLDPLSKGDIDSAVMRYFRIPIDPTPQMLEGSALHEQWRLETLQTGKLPGIFGGHELRLPEVEQKLECVLDDWCQFVGIPDLMDFDTIHEYKTGHSSSLTYSHSMQPLCYQLLTEMNGYKPKKALIHHFNQYTGGISESLIWLSNKSIETAKNWILTYAGELRQAVERTE